MREEFDQWCRSLAVCRPWSRQFRRPPHHPSTPFGKRGFFHHEWAEGGPEWERIEIAAYEVPRIPRAWLDKERKTIGDWWFEQEYLCQFKETTDQVFGYDEVMGALSPDVAPLFPL